MQPELELELVRQDIKAMREDFTDLKEEVKQMRIAITKLISIEDKLIAEREARGLLWSKYEMIDVRLRNIESDMDVVREHKKVFAEHCEALSWCQSHRAWFEGTKNSLIIRITLIALIGWSVVGLMGYAIYNTFKH